MAETDGMERRLTSLAVEFSNATGPLTTDYLRTSYYADLQQESFYRQFQRDRERLVLCGLTVREVGEGQWAAEASSFADEVDADPLDLLALDLTCLQLAADGSFPYRQELRHALAKMDRTFSGSAALASQAAGGGQGAKTLTLLRARGSRHAVRVRYVDAQGAASQRTLALYGEFGLRGHVYFVGCDLDGEGRPSEPHVFRDDRFRQVRELPKVGYDIPGDFCADDWQRLPFQIGEGHVEAELLLPDPVPDECRSALARDGHVEERPDVGRIWHVTGADLRALASWSVAQGCVPLSPTPLVQAWESLLEEVVA